MNIASEYRKFKWFYTSTDKLVVGGKNAEQNDFLLSSLKKTNKDYVVMHTSLPGSPFAVILADKKDVKSKDLEECSIFTACFSKAWSAKKKEALVDVFSMHQVSKSTEMKTGTWSVQGKVQRVKALISLVLTKQDGVLRCVPPSVASKKDILCKIIPGNIDKTSMPAKIALEIDSDLNQQELLAALPAGGFKFIKALGAK